MRLHLGRSPRGKAMAAAAICWTCLQAGQMQAQSPDEHAQHHPPAAPAAAPAASVPGAPASAAVPPAGGMPAGGAPAAGGGMMEQMGEMMKSMGKPPPKEVYPSLMVLPELTPEKRQEVEQQAGERMRTGARLMGMALDQLNAGLSSDDYAAMHAAMTQFREGVAQFDSGIAARRALAQTQAPREVALAWFKSEMRLTVAASPPSAQALGASPFHLFAMALLVAFALAMVVMYFFKMRRAAALFGRIEADKGSPPPGSSPQPAGDKPPPGGKPPSGDKPDLGDKSAPAGSSADVASKSSSAPPVSANWRGQLRVGSIITEAPGVKTFRLLPPVGENLLPFSFVPGQFLNVAFSIGGARMNRSYSISSSPNERSSVDLTVRREPRGAISRHIVDLLKVGDEIETSGPVGRFTFTGSESDSIVLLSGGVGITPMVSISRFLTERAWPGEIYFIYTCRTQADFILGGEMAALQRRNPKLHVTVTLTKPEGTEWKGPRGRITKELLAQAVPNLAARRVHICGPVTMMDSTRALLIELGVPPEQVKTEAFGAVKPTPAAPGTTASPSAPATGPLVTFSKNSKSSKIREGQTVLELSEELAIGIEYSCRVGTCGICKVKMTSGEVTMEIDEALEADDKSNGLILACQAIPKGEIAVEA